MTRLDPEIVDFYTYEVVKKIMEKYGMTEMDAYLDFVKSETHALVENVNMGMTQFWLARDSGYPGVGENYRRSEKFHIHEVLLIMSVEMEFFIYLMEQYAAYKNMMTGDVVRLIEEKNLIDVIYNDYWGYHTESINNAFVDIDSLISTGRHAY